MGITTTAASRETNLQPSSTPEQRNESLRRSDERMDRALRELAYTPVIRTIDWPMVAFEDDIGGEGGES